MPFNDPNYTKPRMGSALGALLTNFAGGVQGQRQNALAQQQLAYQNPDRPLGPRDLLGLVLEDYKAKNQMNQFQVATNPQAPIQAYDPAALIQSLQAALSGQGRQAPAMPQSPAPAQPSTPAPVSRGGGNLQAVADEMRKRGLFT